MSTEVAANLPGIVVSICALLVAILFVVISKKTAGANSLPLFDDDSVDAYDALIAQLREHIANRHLQTEIEWNTEKNRLEELAAKALVHRETQKHEDLKQQKRLETVHARNSRFTRWATVVILICAVGAAGVFASKEAVPKPVIEAQNAPPKAEAPSADLMQHVRDLDAHPDDLDTIVRAARVFVKQKYYQDAQTVVQRGSAIDPYDVELRTYRALFLAFQEKPIDAFENLQHLTDTYDGISYARLWSGQLAMEANNLPRAYAQFELYFQEAPETEHPPMLKMQMAKMKEAMKSPQKGM